MKSIVFAIASSAILLATAACSKTSSHAVMSYHDFVAGLDANAPADPDCKTNDCQERRHEFEYVVYVGKQIYCYWDLKQADTGADFNALAKTLETSITDKTSFSEYFLTLRKWASAFHDGHVNVMPKSDMSDLEIYSAPIRVEVMAPATDHEKVIIVNIAPGAVNVGAGDEIISIDGVAVKDAITTAAKDSASGSTERMRRYSAGRRLVDVLGLEAGSKPMTLVVKPYSGAAMKTVSLLRTIQIDAKPSKKDDPEPETTGVELLTAKILPGGIGYLRIDGFDGTQDFQLLAGIMKRLSNTTGLILDLRKNGGGDLAADSILARLAKTSIIRYKRSERLNDFVLAQRPENFALTPDPTGLFSTWHDLTVEPIAAEHYDKPVVALISPYCFSACDTFSSALKTNGLATFVGEPTGGGTGTPLVFDLPTSPLQFRYSVIRGQSAKGDAIEAVGTSPDVYIEPTVSDRAMGTDSQLVKAIEVVQKLAQPSVPPTPVDLTGVPLVTSGATGRAPTAEDNDWLMRISGHDEL